MATRKSIKSPRTATRNETTDDTSTPTGTVLSESPTGSGGTVARRGAAATQNPARHTIAQQPDPQGATDATLDPFEFRGSVRPEAILSDGLVQAPDRTIPTSGETGTQDIDADLAELAAARAGELFTDAGGRASTIDGAPADGLVTGIAGSAAESSFGGLTDDRRARIGGEGELGRDSFPTNREESPHEAVGTVLSGDGSSLINRGREDVDSGVTGAMTGLLDEMADSTADGASVADGRRDVIHKGSAGAVTRDGCVWDDVTGEVVPASSLSNEDLDAAKAGMTTTVEFRRNDMDKIEGGGAKSSTNLLTVLGDLAADRSDRNAGVDQKSITEALRQVREENARKKSQGDSNETPPPAPDTPDAGNPGEPGADGGMPTPAEVALRMELLRASGRLNPINPDSTPLDVDTGGEAPQLTSLDGVLTSRDLVGNPGTAGVGSRGTPPLGIDRDSIPGNDGVTDPLEGNAWRGVTRTEEPGDLNLNPGGSGAAAHLFDTTIGTESSSEDDEGDDSSE